MYKSLDTKGITVMRINAIIIGVITLFIAALVAAYIYPNLKEDYIKIIITVVLGIIMILVFLQIIIFPNIRYKRYKYLIGKDRIEVQKGLFIITTSIIQIKRIQKIELTNGPIDRYFGLSNVNIYTAAGTVDIKFLNTTEALDISEKVNNLLKRKLTKKKKPVKKK